MNPHFFFWIQFFMVIDDHKFLQIIDLLFFIKFLPFFEIDLWDLPQYVIIYLEMSVQLNERSLENWIWVKKEIGLIFVTFKSRRMMYRLFLLFECFFFIWDNIFKLRYISNNSCLNSFKLSKKIFLLNFS